MFSVKAFHNRGSQTSEYRHSEQCTTLVDFQAKGLQSI